MRCFFLGLPAPAVPACAGLLLLPCFAAVLRLSEATRNLRSALPLPPLLAPCCCCCCCTWVAGSCPLCCLALGAAVPRRLETSAATRAEVSLHRASRKVQPYEQVQLSMFFQARMEQQAYEQQAATQRSGRRAPSPSITGTTAAGLLRAPTHLNLGSVGSSANSCEVSSWAKRGSERSTPPKPPPPAAGS